MVVPFVRRLIEKPSIPSSRISRKSKQQVSANWNAAANDLQALLEQHPRVAIAVASGVRKLVRRLRMRAS